MNRKYRFFQLLGFALIGLGMGLVLISQLQSRRASQQNAVIAERISSLLPSGNVSNPADYSQPEMPVLQIDGSDFVCLLDVPTQGITLPVLSQWDTGKLPSHPCRFWGSIYDGTMILGGSSGEGQFDFCSRLELGDKIQITDMQGGVFLCRVDRIDRSNSADFDKLSDLAYPLTLFVREEYDNRYIIVRCQWAYE